MTMARRELLMAAVATPLLAACATDLTHHSDEPLPALAARLGVCAASCATVPAEHGVFRVGALG